jgi:hypothetical protein
LEYYAPRTVSASNIGGKAVELTYNK